MSANETRVWNDERFGYDVTGPCWMCQQPIRYFVDEDGTPRDIEPANRLRETLADLLLAGQHDGPCDNDDSHEDACNLHIAASERRRAAAEAALRDS